MKLEFGSKEHVRRLRQMEVGVETEKRVNHQNLTLFLRHDSGATHALRGRKLAKLLSELKVNRGGPELTSLVEAGYTETLGGVDISGLDYANVMAEAR